MRNHSSQTTRQALLDAALVILECERGEFTLEAVAAQAQVSKGGLLHHFATKRELLSAVISQHLERHEGWMTEALEQSGLNWTQAYVQAAFSTESVPVATMWALIAAVRLDATLLEQVRQAFTRWQQQLESSGVPLGRAMVVRLAVEGLALSMLLDLAVPRAEALAELKSVLENLAIPVDGRTET
jgi:AcrR family transcriptional regulator